MNSKFVLASILFYSCICSSQSLDGTSGPGNIPSATAPDCPEQFSSSACEEERVKKNYTITSVERTIAGKTLNIPANFISAGNFGPVRKTGSEATVAIFMPNFVGYSRDNWRNTSTNNDHIWVAIKSASDRSYVNAVEGAVKSSIVGNAPISRALGFDAYLYDFRKSSAEEPLPTYVAKKASVGDPAFVLCRQPKNGEGRCELSLIHTESNLFIRARFAVQHAPQWLEIENGLRKLLSGWLVR